MANPWLRLWRDMPNDPKWRTIARISDEPIPSVLGVYLHLLVSASEEPPRGQTNIHPEDTASALGIETESVQRILDAMQGRVLDGNLVTGWEKRQPIREGNSTERTRKWRERTVTQRDAPVCSVTQSRVSSVSVTDGDISPFR